MTEIVSMAAEIARRECDNRKWTVKDCLQDNIKEIDAGRDTPTSALILLLDNDPDKTGELDRTFDAWWSAANMSRKEMVFLLEYMKSRIIREMDE